MSQKHIQKRVAAPIWRRHALAGACLVTLAGFSATASAQVPGAALIATNAVLLTGDPTTPGIWWTAYGLPAINNQFGESALAAYINNVQVGSVSSITGVPVGGSSTNVNNNSMFALAIGNENLIPISGLSLLSATGGLLGLNLQIQSGGIDSSSSFTTRSVDASITDSSLVLTQAGMATAALSLSGNTLSAGTQINLSDSLASGATPAGYESTAQGSGSVAFSSARASMGAPATSNAGSTGSVNLSSLQSTFNVASTTSITDSTVALAVSGTPPISPATTGVFSSTVAVNGNTVSAASVSNAATNVFQAAAGSAAWNGSVSVTSLQSNVVDGTLASSLASVTGSSVTADLRAGGTGQTDLTGTLALDGNTLRAGAAGNAAGARGSNGLAVAGNAIVFNGSADITGAGSSAGGAVALGSASSAGDLTLLSAQANFGSSYTANLGGTDAVGVRSWLDNLDGGTLTQSGNALASTATANLAVNLIGAGQSASLSNLTASASAVNVQANSGVSALASVQAADVTATVGIAGAVPTGKVTMDQNILAATAEANVGVTTVTLKATNLNVSGSLDASTPGGVRVDPSAGTASAGVGVVALNVQSNSGPTLTSNNEDTSVALRFQDQAGTPAPLAVTGMEATLSRNVLQATSTANSAITSVLLQGTNAPGLSVAVGSSQQNTEGVITATAGLLAPLAVSLLAGNVSSSTLSVTGNEIGALSRGNVAESTLRVLMASDVSASASVSVGVPNAVASNAAGVGVEAVADLALANAQWNVATNLTAATEAGVTMTVGSVGTGSALSLTGNTLSAQTYANSASNELRLGNASAITNLSGMTAALASGQSVSGATSLLGATTVARVGLDTTGAITGAGSTTLSVNTNAITAAVIGNSALNTLALVSTNASGSNVATPSAGTASTGATVAADFALGSNQSVADASVTAGSTGNVEMLVGGLLPAAVSGAALTLKDNTVSSLASANDVTNQLTLGVTTLTAASAGLASRQSLDTTSVGSTTEGGLRINAADITASTLTLSGNTVKSTALGNVAGNTLSATGTNATGGSATPGTPAVTAGTEAKAQADFMLGNAQVIANTPISAATGATGTPADVTLNVGSVGTGSALSLTGNTLSAQTYANSASNELRLGNASAITNLSGMTAALASGQSVTGGASLLGATTDGLVELNTSDVSVEQAMLTVHNNAITAAVTGNSALNTLALVSTNASGRNVAAPSAGTASTGATVAADFALGSNQAVTDGGLTATANGAVHLVVAVGKNSVDGSPLTLRDNTISAASSGNTVGNQLSLNVTSLTAASGALASRQTLDNLTSLGSTSKGEMSIESGDVIGSNLTLSGNIVQANAAGNAASNLLRVQGTTMTGRLGPAVTEVAGTGNDSVSVVADQAIANSQSVTRGELLRATTDGDLQILPGVYPASGSTLTLKANTLAATASANDASNQLTLNVSNLTAVSAGLASRQILENSTGVQGTSTGRLLIESATVTSANLILSDNTITATALGNMATNQLGVQSTNATGVLPASSALTSSVSSTDVKLHADFALASLQSIVNSEISASTSGQGLSLSVGDVGAGSTLTLSGNTNQALAQGNSAANVLTLGVTQLAGLSAGIASGQTSAGGNVTATAKSSASIVSGDGLGLVTGTPVAITGNTVNALTGMNEVVNSLTATGSTLTGRLGVPQYTAGVAETKNVDFSIVNAQSGAGNVSATVNDGAHVFQGALDGGSLAITGNTVLASATGNSAGNSLKLSASSSVNATAAVSNVQSMSGDVTAAVYDAGAAAPTIGASLASSNGAILTAAYNRVMAQAAGNQVTNALNVSAVSGIGAGGASTNPSFAVMNSQQTAAGSSISASLGSASFGLVRVGLYATGSVVASTLSVQGNQLGATAYGNNANNAIAMSALAKGMNNASAGISNVQYNLSAVTASVTGVHVGVTGPAVGGGMVNVSGNTITARAVGNSAVNAITSR